MTPHDAGRTGRTAALLLAVSTALFLGAWLWAWVVLPADGVVQHIGPDGPDRTGSRGGLLWPLLVSGPVVVCGLHWLVAAIVRSGDGTGLNYPHKTYWLAPERREAFRRRVVGEFDVFLAATMLLLVVVLVEAVRVTDDPGSRSLMVPTLVAYGLFCVCWVVWLLRRSRPPADDTRVPTRRRR